MRSHGPCNCSKLGLVYANEYSPYTDETVLRSNESLFGSILFLHCTPSPFVASHNNLFLLVLTFPLPLLVASVLGVTIFTVSCCVVTTVVPFTSLNFVGKQAQSHTYNTYRSTYLKTHLNFSLCKMSRVSYIVTYSTNKIGSVVRSMCECVSLSYLCGMQHRRHCLLTLSVH